MGQQHLTSGSCILFLRSLTLATSSPAMGLDTRRVRPSELWRPCGATLAIASVAVDIAGVEMTMHFAVRREGGGHVVEVPSFIHDGQRVACVILLPELRDAIC